MLGETLLLFVFKIITIIIIIIVKAIVHQPAWTFSQKHSDKLHSLSLLKDGQAPGLRGGTPPSI